MADKDDKDPEREKKDPKDRGIIERIGADGKPVYYVRLAHAGRIRWFGGYRKITEARNFYQNAKTDQRRGRFFPEEYQRGGSELVKDVLDRHADTTTVKNTWAEKNYANWWKARLKGKRLREITPADIEDAQRDLSKAGLAPQTSIHYLKFLRHVLNVAVRDGKLTRNPFAQVKMPKPPKGRLRFLSLDEETALSEKIGEPYRWWVRLAILTGLRLGELLGLKWADVQGDVLAVAPSKGHGVEYVHLTDEARIILERLKVGNHSVWLFPSKNPERPLNRMNFYARIFVPAVQAAELEGVTFHTTRHTFASRLAMSGATEGEIAAALRHTSTALVKRYAHLSPTHLKGVMQKVAAFGQPEADGTPSVEKSEIAPQAPPAEDRAEAPNMAEVKGEVGAGDGI